MKSHQMVKKIGISAAFAFAAIVFFAAVPSTAFGQDDRSKIDKESVSKAGEKVADFVPKGWMIEDQINGDVNDDGIADHLLKLVEDAKSPSGDTYVERSRALVILFADKDGHLRNAAVADKLLQCTSCGGAFYGTGDAPSDVKIEKGVIIVNQDHGSRNVTETTYRFRYDEQPGMFILIGFDYSSRDRAAGGSSTESTNYLTGKRITTTSKGKKTTSKTTQVTKMSDSIEEVDSDKFEEEATKRLGLD